MNGSASGQSFRRFLRSLAHPDSHQPYRLDTYPH